MPSQPDLDLHPEFDNIKDDDENILWTGKPEFVPFVLNGLGAFTGAVIFFLIGYFTVQNMGKGFEGQINFYYIFSALPLLFVTLNFLKRIFSYTNTSYAYTSKRIMIRTGFIGIDIKSIDYDKVSDIEVTVNVLEKIFSAGSIRFFSGRTETNDGTTAKLYDKWEAISDPYGVFKRVKQVSADIKTDYNYPNALRPDTNPGYHTQYKREE